MVRVPRPATRFAFLDAAGPLAFAHRGGASEFPENTLPAFEGAVRLGYRYLETDVHLTADGVLVAFHDEALDRVTDRTGRIADLPYREVAKALVDGREPIPRFDELLAAFPDTRFNVDAKEDRAVDPLAEVVRRGGAIDRVNLAAFDDARLARLRGILGPRLCTALGPRATARVVAASRHVGRPSFAAGCVQVPTTYRGRPLLTERFVDTAHRLGLQVHVWTIDDPEEMTRLLELGVDGIMTDRPAVLRRVLEDRGEWNARPD